MQHYFTQLSKDKKFDFQTNNKVSKAIMHTAQRAFTPFYQYLDTTIKALDKKEDIKATWSKVKEDNLVELKIIGSLYEVSKSTKIKLLNIEKGLYTIKGDFEKDFDIPLIIWNNNEKIKIKLNENNFVSSNTIKLDDIYENITKANWAGDDVQIKPTWTTVHKNDTIVQGNQNFKIKYVHNNVIEIQGVIDSSTLTINNKPIDFEIISVSKQPINTILIQEEKNRVIVYDENDKGKHNFKLQNLLNKESITFEDGSRFNGEHQELLTFKLDNNKIVGKKVVCDKVKFTIEKLRNTDKNQYWIQLEELGNEKEDIPGFSPLKYFFDDDIDIYSEADAHIKDYSKRTKYLIEKGDEKEHKLILKSTFKKDGIVQKNKKGDPILKPSFPPNNYDLQVKVNTYQLRKQLEAVSTLQKMPVGSHSNLIKLFEDRTKVQWHKTTKNTIVEKDWIVLTDNNRSGSFEQRDFVEKALATPDFAILEGPPGSGKTTVILELICQLAKQGKRILLCGSTHVAIDNVLERLKDKDSNDKTLIEQYAILPVRIGGKNRINQDIKEFQINNLQEEHHISENLLLDTANLVCGTTIGILQHPKFKQRNEYFYDVLDEKGKPKKLKRAWVEPIIPEFDYLIIDESSKTTFQEFLVPGLYAKKWILAGDVMQLSPFTDREQIVTNLECLPLKNGKTLPVEYQQAVFYLLKLLEITCCAENKFIFPVSEKLMEAFDAELKERKPDKIITLFDKNKFNKLELIGSDIIIIDKTILDNNLINLPGTHAILRSESWNVSKHAFIHQNWLKTNSFKKLIYKNKKTIKIDENSFDIVENTNAYFKEKSWAEEIAWRIDRVHQLRLRENKTIKYRNKIRKFIPLAFDSTNIEDQINTLARIAFPSILESLIGGIENNRPSDIETTISKGFTKDELEIRRTVLKYQHRMHPEISKFPREQFYKNENDALLDLEHPTPINILREWSYNRYKKHSIWVDVKGKTSGNKNTDEAIKIISELKKFIEYASENEQPEGKEWTVACLTFYRGQEKILREKLQKLTNLENGFSHFSIEKNKIKINIKLHTVDKFQGHEADIVFLSMVQTHRDGFMDNPNRLNVAITRAKFQLVIVGDHNYFSEKSRSTDLKQLAKHTQIH